MPAKNALKYYKKDSFYHIYNRGVAKSKIFLDEQDYKVFLSYLKVYLEPISLQGESLQVAPSKMLKNYSEEVDLISYCLMPNHFHLLVYQSEKFSINYFMRSLATKYSMFFNKKYERVGCVFQGVYKGVRVDSEEQLVYLSKYIHRNPVEILPAGRVLVGFKYSSYPNYLGLINQIWVKPKAVLSYFTRENKIISYQNFVEEVGENYKAVNKFLIDQEPAGRVLAG